MPIHNYIINIYKNVPDRAYVVRFCEYFISKYFNSTDIYINNIRFRQLISGIIEGKDGTQYKSYADVYNSNLNNNIDEYDVSILNHIYITTDCTLANLLSRITEQEILGFIDKKFRIFCLYRDLKHRIKEKYTISKNNVSSIKIVWDNQSYDIGIHNIEPDTYCNYLLEAYETTCISGLYYVNDKNKKCLLV